MNLQELSDEELDEVRDLIRDGFRRMDHQFGEVHDWQQSEARERQSLDDRAQAEHARIWNALTDSELQEIFHAATEETSRRNLITAALTREPILQTGYLAALDRADGEPWQQPTGAHDAYPKDWIALHDGKTWVSLTAANVWVPGETGWREITADGEAPPEWVQPTGAHDAYKKGDQVTHKDGVWTSDSDGNVWEPGVYGWTKN